MNNMLFIVCRVGLCFSALFSAFSFAAPGDFDTSFGSGAGWVHSNFGNPSSMARALMQQADGKLVTVGSTMTSSHVRQLLVARYNLDGSLDASFNGTGSVTIDDGSGEIGQSVLQQADGKLVVAGYNGNGSYVLARLNSSGSLDNGFNSTGIVSTRIGSGTLYLARKVIQQVDGKLVVVGMGDNYNYAMLRYNSDGSLDTTFNTSGRVNSINNESANSIAQLANGKLLVAGYSGASFMLAQYHADGSLDTTFNGSGKVFTSYSGTQNYWADLKVQADGKYLVAGCSDSTLMLGRYNSNGALDSSFGGGGLVAGPSGYCASSVVIQADGNIDVAGSQFSLSNPGYSTEFLLARYNNAGVLDTSFASNGLKIFSVASGQAGANAAIQQHDGKIVLAGGSQGLAAADMELVLARVQSGQLDSDADGWVNGLDVYPTNPNKWKSDQIQKDFNGDGIADVLVRDTSSGNWQAFLFSNAAVTGSSPLAIPYAADNLFIAKLDANGDGTADVLTRSATTGVWSISTISNGSVTTVSSPTMTTSPSWVFQGAADFNGDGTDDILLRNTSNNSWYVYYLQDSTVLGSSGAGIYTNPDFQFQGAGDLNGDGKADVLFRSQSTGAWYVYNFANNSVSTPGGLWVSGHWQYQGLVDMNGDGKKDILLRDTFASDPYPGTWGAFISSGNGFGISYNYALNGTYINLNLISLATIGDYNGDGVDDLLLRNTGNGQYYLFTTNVPGTAGAGYQTLRGSPALPSSPWGVMK